MPPSNPLPPKENALFKRILRCYEHKQYKNALKFAKQILSNPKYGEHGETLAMKGLTLNCLGRKDEAYEYVRRGLRNDLKSPVCWHVYGLLQRSDKKYDEAIKCYRNALKWEKDNIQILRDLSLLQIQMRDLEGYKDTRYQLFVLRPTQRTTWIGFAMSYHLLGEHEMANSILDAFRTNQMKGPYDYEHSELLLYQNMVLAESGHYDRALQHLTKFESQILDKLSIKETSGEYYLKLKRYNEAESVYVDLLKRNPENVMYYQKLIEAKQFSNADERVAFFEEYKKEFLKAIAPRRLQLTEAQSQPIFEKLVDEYLRHGLHKGIPPLFVDLRSLYVDQFKADTIEKLILQYVENLSKNDKFSSRPDEERQPASALLWTYYFAAQHFDYKMDTARALSFIDAAIEHTPTLIELFIAKGRIYKHAGDPISAYQMLEEAQAMDTADRYVNSKCARYMLRAGHIKRAEEMCAKFTREGVPATENLNEMQCMWFQTEAAAAYQRLQQWGEALKKAHEVDRHFSEIMEDQFDFHSYCMRKMTLRSYVGLLRLEDVLRAHPFYFRCARVAIQVYLTLYEHPLQDAPQTSEPDTENLAPSELKKLRNKQRKAKRKAEQESALAAQVQVKREQHHKARQQQEQGDPEAPQLDELIPEKLARAEDPLEQAMRFLLPLRLLAADRIDTHLMAFEIYYRKEKPLLMLQSIKRAWNLQSDHHHLHDCMIRFKCWLDEKQCELNPHVASVINAETQPMFGERSALTMAQEYLESHGNSSQACALWAARALARLVPERTGRARGLVTSLALPATTIQGCVEVLESLKDGDFGSCEKEIEDYIEACRAKFPYANAFKPPQELPENQTDDTPLQPKEIDLTQ
ncbi:N-alpha-acetyltransferase 15, NatA auxiliary subunit [Leptidea sinapis]|uniref:N-alpha-acetyltransferase 15, NatA auxiliary subunit n=1 Tax=Leptidea sinapis TaxID=189913 RepID=UPI00214281D5|nr:N-alpha-acetyltransferase 15, NatA auxiliary subunit [Leptidea sinapis]XP_050682769.1 N-alpha-acetyltransferase 15, NatA auxiliary subunit [Leptidea sinapis]